MNDIASLENSFFLSRGPIVVLFQFESSRDCMRLPYRERAVPSHERASPIDGRKSCDTIARNKQLKPLMAYWMNHAKPLSPLVDIAPGRAFVRITI